MAEDTQEFCQMAQPLLTWTDADIKVMQRLIRGVVSEELRKAMSDHKTHCRFSISDENVEQMSHMVGVYQDLGDDSMSKGLEVIRDNHRWMRTMRERSDRAGSIFFLMITTAAIGGLIAACWEGLKDTITR